MARSADPHPPTALRATAVRSAAGIAVLGAAGLLAGCATTMDEAARLQLNSARIRASQVSTRVTVANPTVAVSRLSIVSAGGRAAFVVTLHNAGRRAVSDLPISIGYRRAGHPVTYLNAADTLGYFQSHLPAIRAGASLTWVYTGGRALPSGAHPFALVGATPSAAAHPSRELPVITVASRGALAADRLRISLANRSAVPQYQLQVYAVADRSGRPVAAGDLTIAHLGTGSTRTLELPVLGSLSRATVQLEALPTIFH